MIGLLSLMWLLLAVSCTPTLAADSASTDGPLPNFVFIMMDDWGYPEDSTRNPSLITPNFHQLITTGLRLERHYTFKYCSPTRASFLSGRFPHHAHQWNPDVGDEPLALNLNFTLLPKKLKSKNYATHMIGKWHEGFFTEAALPINRGFDTSSGFLTGGCDHFSNVHGCAVDFWHNNAPDPRNSTEKLNGYDAYVYRDDVVSILDKHNTSQPFFMYLALHVTHDPIEAPNNWTALYANTSLCEARKVFQAMATIGDNVTGILVEKLKERGMWNNTLLVVSGDNGAQPCRSSSYPLKGSKITFFEGGVRSNSFVNGGLLPDAVRGTSLNSFFHVADWYATFLGRAGIDPDDSGEGKFPIDSVDVWPLITGQAKTTSRRYINLGYEYNNQGALLDSYTGNKLIVGPQDFETCQSMMYSPLDYPCSDGPLGSECDPYCLYNVVDDPLEMTDMSLTNASLLQDMLNVYNLSSKEPRWMQDQGIHSDDQMPHWDGACGFMNANGGYWRPWVNV